MLTQPIPDTCLCAPAWRPSARRTFWFRCFLLLPLLLLLPLPLCAATGAPPAAPTAPASLTPAYASEYPDLEMLADPDGRLNLADVLAAAAAGHFQPITNAFAGGYTRQVHWFRFTLPAPPPQASAGGIRRLMLEVQPSYLDDVRLYVPQPGAPGKFEERVAGDLQPYASRELPNRNFIFYLHFASAEPQTYYLRLRTSSSSFLLLRTWTPPELARAQTQEYALLGLYYGLMLALLFLNLWHGQWRQEPAYLPFIAYLIAMILLMLGVNGLVSEYLLPEHPEIASDWVSYFVLIGAGLAARFHRAILSIDRRQPLLNAYFTGITWLALAGCLSVPLGYFLEVVRIVMFLSMFGSLFGLIRSYQLWREQQVGSHFLVLANLLTLGGYSYTMAGLLGFSQGQLSQIYGVQLSSLLSLLAFNAVLLSRMRHLHQAHQQAQKAVQQAQSAHVATQLAQQRQGALLSMLTHELKTPLGVIRLALDRLSGDGTALHHARAAVLDISAVVDRCMQVDKLDKEAQPIRPVNCDLNQLLLDICRHCQEPARVQFIRPTPLPLIKSDPLLLRTILANLLDNALKYSPAGSPVLLSAVTQAQEDQGTTRNTGSPGVLVSCENQEGSCGRPDPARIYERYYRSPSAYARSGSGLGLFIARQLAERLDISLRYIPPSGRHREAHIRFDCWIPCTPP